MEDESFGFDEDHYIYMNITVFDSNLHLKVETLNSELEVASGTF